MLPGRNDPCPCGSGRKFKRCHGATAAVAEATASPLVSRANVLKARDAELSDRLMRWTRRQHGSSWVGSLIDSSFRELGGELAEADLPIVIPWLLHLRADDSGTTLEDQWAREPQTRLSADDAALMAAYGETWVSIWEVAAVEPGTGVQLADALTGETRFVHDVSSAASLRPFDSILAMVLTCDGVSFFGGAHGRALPPVNAEVAVREAKRLCRVRTRRVPPERLRSQGMQMALFALWSAVVEQMMNRPAPVLSNTDGDPMQITSDDYALVASRDVVARALASVPGADADEPDGGSTVFTVTKPGNAVNRSWDNTIIARIVLSAARLTVETNSVRRADAMRAEIEARLAGLVRFRLRKEENTAQLMAAAMEGAAKQRGANERGAKARAAARPARRGERIDPVALAAMREFRERHMRAWIDDSIPALGGLTPRAAARSARERPRLEALLKEIVQREAEYPEDQRIDLEWIWEELGLS